MPGLAYNSDYFYLVEDVNGKETLPWHLTFSIDFLSVAWYSPQVRSMSVNNEM